MALNRQDMLKQLDLVAPALAEHDLVPVWTHLLFTGSNVVAYDDRIGISAPLRTSFKGTVPGKMLIDLLRSGTHTDEIDLVAAGDGVQLIAEKAKGTLESNSIEEFIFKMPARPKEAAKLDDKFLKAITDGMHSVNEHAVQPDQLGVTLIAAGKQLKLYSTDSIAMTHSKLALPPQLGLGGRVILPTAFCKQLLRLAENATRRALSIQRDYALFMADDMLLFGRLVQSDKPLDFDSVLARSQNGQKLVKLNEQQRPRLKVALDWASRICDIKGNEVRTNIKVRGGVMELTSSSNRGQAFDRINIKHPDVDCKLQASYLRDVYDRYEDILLTRECALMTRDNAEGIYVVACY